MESWDEGPVIQFFFFVSQLIVYSRCISTGIKERWHSAQEVANDPSLLRQVRLIQYLSLQGIKKVTYESINIPVFAAIQDYSSSAMIHYFRQ